MQIHPPAKEPFAVAHSVVLCANRVPTIKAALRFAAGKVVTALAEGVLQTMGISRAKVAVAVAAMLTLMVAGPGAGVLAGGGRPANPKPRKTADPAPNADETAGQLRKKAIARRDLARSAFEGYLPLFQFNKVSEQTVNLWSRR